MKILIVKLGALGDVVRTGYILPGLLARFPGARIWWLCGDAAELLIRQNPLVRKVVTFRAGIGSEIPGIFDWILSLEEGLSVLKEVRKIGYKRISGVHLKNSRVAYTQDMREWYDMSIISRFGLERANALKKQNIFSHEEIIGNALGIAVVAPSFFGSVVADERARGHISPRYYNIGLNSGSGGHWPCKALLFQEQVKLCRSLTNGSIGGKPIRVYLLGGLSERKLNQQVKRSVGSPSVKILDSSKDLLYFAAIVRAMDYVVTTDSLALHLAIAQGVHTTSFFTTTSAAEINTFGLGVKIRATSRGYCSYRPFISNKTITAVRIINKMTGHLCARGIEFSLD